MTQLATRFLRARSGATAIEYGLVAGLVAVAIIGTLSGTGTSLSDLLKGVGNKVNAMPKP